jgi:hypothetical protein
MEQRGGTYAIRGETGSAHVLFLTLIFVRCYKSIVTRQMKFTGDDVFGICVFRLTLSFVLSVTPKVTLFPADHAVYITRLQQRW